MLPLALSSLSASITLAPSVTSFEAWVRSSKRRQVFLADRDPRVETFVRHVTEQALAQLAGGGALFQVLGQVGRADQQLAVAHAALPDQAQLAVGVPVVNWLHNRAQILRQRIQHHALRPGHDLIPLPVLEERRWGIWPGRDVWGRRGGRASGGPGCGTCSGSRRSAQSRGAGARARERGGSSSTRPPASSRASASWSRLVAIKTSAGAVGSGVAG